MSDQSERATPRDRRGVAILYGCQECGETHFRKFGTAFGHFINEVDCPECGHTISGEYER